MLQVLGPGAPGLRVPTSALLVEGPRHQELKSVRVGAGGSCSDLYGYRRVLKAISVSNSKAQGALQREGCAVASAPCDQTAGATEYAFLVLLSGSSLLFCPLAGLCHPRAGGSRTTAEVGWRSLTVARQPLRSPFWVPQFGQHFQQQNE